MSIHEINAETGRLTSRDSFAIPGSPDRLILHPSGQFGYINLLSGSDRKILIFTVDDAGALSQRSELALSESPRHMRIDPSGRFLYVATADSRVASYSINPGSGDLELVNVVATAGGPQGIAVAPTSGFLYVGGSGGTISIHSITSGGSLDETPSSVGAGTGVVESMIVDSSGKFLYAITSNGSALEISTFAINSETGALNFVQAASKQGVTLSSLAIDPASRFLYATDRFGNLVTAYQIEGDGSLSSRGSFAAGRAPFAIGAATLSA